MKKILRRSLALALALACAVCFASAGFAATPTPDESIINAEAVYLYNVDTDTVVYEKNAHEVRAAASLTKMMTGLLLAESGEDLTQSYTIPQALTAEFDKIQEENGSDADLKIGETLTLQDLLYACMLPSANDAASVIAYYLSNGDMDAFFARMNQRAAELGCQNTNFVCAHGLYGLEYGNYSTAYDQFLIANACRQNGLLMSVVCETGYWLPLTNLHTTPKTTDAPEGMSRYIGSTNVLQNPQQELYRSYIQGLKTGFTDEAGRCFASTAVQNGQTWVMVVLGAPRALAEDGFNYSFHTTVNVYDWVFDTFWLAGQPNQESPIASLPLRWCEQTETLPLYADESLLALMTANTEVTLRFDGLPETVETPVAAGTQLGSVTVLLDGEELGSVTLSAKADYAKSNRMYYAELLRPYLPVAVAVLVLLLLLMMAAVALRRRAKRRRKATQMRNAQRQRTHLYG